MAGPRSTHRYLELVASQKEGAVVPRQPVDRTGGTWGGSYVPLVIVVIVSSFLLFAGHLDWRGGNSPSHHHALVAAYRVRTCTLPSTYKSSKTSWLIRASAECRTSASRLHHSTYLPAKVMLSRFRILARPARGPSSQFPSMSVLRMSTSPTPSSSSDEEDESKTLLQSESWTEKGKRFLKVYGTVGVVTHTVLSLASYSLIYVSVSRGLDVGSFLGSWTTSIQAAVAHSSSNTTNVGVETASNAVVSYAIYKLLAPIRWPLTFFLTPVVVRQWNKIRPSTLPPTTTSKKASSTHHRAV
ncbi:Aste57867_10914 [Aphanomyces stellatus]|uniref:Aste57867_10914 protein n=1 Tax=Aphanomyces stellatus TaxID=120398 RepID=A0A485KS53_9STRA|nr:hypothetical protein As57867_010874 [Aphanomyces stellatus]VFT87782.1 Aste57867_10914 [Aphanomyces stellatus]